MLGEIDSINGDELLNTSPDTLADYFAEKHSANVPTLQENRIEVSHDEVKFRGMLGTEYAYHVPFDGDRNLFLCLPSTFGARPRATVTETELVCHIQVFPNQPASVSGQFDANLNTIRDFLATMRQDVAGYNDSLRAKAAERIAARSEKLLEDRRQVSALGYPIRRRDGAGPYAVPSVRRKPPIQRPSGGRTPFAPEPRLEMAEYEHILSIMASVGRTMELSPSAFKDMREEDLRSHFLVQLNGHYEGQASGANFNLAGKTDIIIRDKGRNIFIAECKFWKGPKGLRDAIGQLLDYTSWRDTKTAIVLFNREQNLSAVLGKIPPAVEEHPNHLRRLDYKSETGFRFAMQHRDDPGRVFTLTIVVFEVPTASPTD